MTAQPAVTEPGPDLVVTAARTLVAGVLRPAVLEVTGGLVTAVVTGAAVRAALAELPASAARVELGEDDVLLPGNVDTHVHVNEPGRTPWEGFATATEAAARGGVTCLVDMPLNSVPPTVDAGALAAKQRAAEPQVRVDVGFWGGAVPANLGTGDLPRLWELGVFGFKCFLADSGVPEFQHLEVAQLHAAMAEIAGFGGLLIVHAEDADVLAAAGRGGGGGGAGSGRVESFRDFARTRPDDAEVTAIRHVIAGVREYGVRAHVLHLSSARALDDLAAARAEGLPITVETCPHYLVFDVDALPDAAAEFKCCPPIRDLGNQRALWEALVDGVIDCVVSDHSPSTLAEKRRGDGDLVQAWGGISGLQVSFPTMVDAAAERGIGIESVSRWLAEAPAAVAGVPRKGRIEVGADADLVVYRPGREVTVDAADLAHRNKLSAYTGRTLSGSVVRTLVRGRTVFDADDSTPDLPDPGGRLLRRESP